MDGGRRAWKHLWSTPVPQKIKIFAWKLATEGLATMQNRKRRNLESDSTCRLCGRGEEDGYHAVVACTKSRALREELRKEWELISEDMLVRSGPEWFLLLLDKLDTEERAQVFFLLLESLAPAE